MSRGRRINQKMEKEIFDAGFNDDADAALTNIFKKKRLPNPANIIGLQKEHGGALLLRGTRPEEALGELVAGEDADEEKIAQKSQTLEEEEVERLRREEEERQRRLKEIGERESRRRKVSTHMEEGVSSGDDDNELARINDASLQLPWDPEEAAKRQAFMRKQISSPSAWPQPRHLGTITPQNLSRQNSSGTESSLSEIEERQLADTLIANLGAIDTVPGGKFNDADAESELAALEEQEARAPMSIHNPNASIQEILDTEFVSGDHGLLDIKDMSDNGDCLFRAFALYLNEYPEVFENINRQFPDLDLVSLSGKSGDKIVTLSFELRKIIVGIITSEAYWSGEDGGYKVQLKAQTERDALTKEEYIKHMTLGSKAKTTIESEGEGSRYIPGLNQGGQIEIQVFAEIVAGIQYIVIQANKKLDRTDHNNIQFMVGNEEGMMNPGTLRLLRYEDTFGGDINKPGSHYDFLELTDKGKEVEAGMGELAVLVEEDERIAPVEEGTSPVAATTTVSPEVKKALKKIDETIIGLGERIKSQTSEINKYKERAKRAKEKGQHEQLKSILLMIKKHKQSIKEKKIQIEKFKKQKYVLLNRARSGPNQGTVRPEGR